MQGLIHYRRQNKGRLGPGPKFSYLTDECRKGIVIIGNIWLPLCPGMQGLQKWWMNAPQRQIFSHFQVETKDALLHSINEEFVEAVEVLLDYEHRYRAGQVPVSRDDLSIRFSQVNYVFYTRRSLTNYDWTISELGSHSGGYCDIHAGYHSLSFGGTSR